MAPWSMPIKNATEDHIILTPESLHDKEQAKRWIMIKLAAYWIHCEVFIWLVLPPTQQKNPD
jgi:hypothetical protein